MYSEISKKDGEDYLRSPPAKRRRTSSNSDPNSQGKESQKEVEINAIYLSESETPIDPRTPNKSLISSVDFVPSVKDSDLTI